MLSEVGGSYPAAKWRHGSEIGSSEGIATASAVKHWKSHHPSRQTAFAPCSAVTSKTGPFHPTNVPLLPNNPSIWRTKHGTGGHSRRQQPQPLADKNSFSRMLQPKASIHSHLHMRCSTRQRHDHHGHHTLVVGLGGGESPSRARTSFPADLRFFGSKKKSGELRSGPASGSLSSGTN